MHRRPLGSGRRLAAVGSIIVVVGCLLPWYVWGVGSDALPTVEVRAFSSTGIVAFVAALATLALITLPYASERPVGVDRGLFFWLLAIAALAGVFLMPFTVEGLLGSPEGLLPDRAYGWWISGVGAIVMARAAFEISREPVRR
jgi:hypothetical protein